MFVSRTAHNLPCTLFPLLLPLSVILEVFLANIWMQKPHSSGKTNKEKTIDLLCTFWRTHPDMPDTIRKALFLLSPSYVKSCFSLAAFSSALLSVNRGPHNSSMHHWPQCIRLRLTDSTTCLTTTPLSHTDWACVMDYTVDYDGL